MANIDLKNKDYELQSLDANFDVSLVQCIIIRLTAKRGYYWSNQNLGSRLYQLRNSKDVPQNILLAQQYANEALDDLVPDRVQQINISVSQYEKSRLDLLIEVTEITGEKATILYFVSVGG